MTSSAKSATERKKLLSVTVSLWKTRTSKRCRLITLSEAVRAIQWGDEDLPDIRTEPGTEAGAKNGETGSPDIRSLQFISVSGAYRDKPTGQRLIAPTGLVSVDYENLHLQRASPADWKNQAMRDVPSAAVTMETPSRNGARIIFRAEPAPRNQHEHELAFRAATKELEKARMRHWNQNGRRMNLIIPLHPDPWILVAENPQTLRWTERIEHSPKPALQGKPYRGGQKAGSGYIGGRN